MNTILQAKISIFGEEAKRIEETLTSKTAAIIYIDSQNPLDVDYEELERLDEGALEKLITSSIPGSRLRKEAATRCIKKTLERQGIKSGPVANKAFYRVEQMLNDDATTKRFIMEMRWNFFGLIK